MSGSLICSVGNDTLTISASSMSFANTEVGVTKSITVIATAGWSAELNDPDGLFEINPTAGAGGKVGRVDITLAKANPNVESYSASVVFKSAGLRQSLSLVAEASAATYTPLTYIEATGEQYIDLEYVVKETDVIKMTYQNRSTSNADKFFFGAADGSNGLWISQYSSSAYIRFGHTSSKTVTTIRSGSSLILKKGSLTVGTSSTSLGYTSMPQTNLYLFAGHREGGDAYAFGYVRCMSFAIIDANGDYIMSLSPAKRDNDGKVGLLDSISGRFFINQGQGSDFVAGAEINE